MDQRNFFAKIDQKPTPDLTWNLPEQKQKTIKIIGGNKNNFRAEIKTAEFLTSNYPVEDPILVFPDSLQSQLPTLPKVFYVPSTDSGSFAVSEELSNIMATADYNLLLGDLSKNTITAQAFHDILERPCCPTLITRDAVDLIAEHNPEPILENPHNIFFASMPGLQKLFRAVYYPKMLLLSQSLVQVVDALHKFTLSYPTKIITLHSNQILVAENGEVKAVPLTKSGYAPINFWSGELAAKITVLNLFNPQNFLNATLCALFV